MAVTFGVKRRRRTGARRGRSGVWRRRLGVRVALGVGVSVVLVFGLSQAILPRLAVQQVRDRVRPYGALEHVSISAFPAIELLWGKAERASASAGALSMDEQQAMKLAWEARGVRDSDLSVGALTLRVAGLARGVVLHDVSIRKRGERLFTEGTLERADLEGVSGGGFRVQMLSSAPDTVKVRASGSLFGVRASVEALGVPSEGRLVVQPLNVPFGQFIGLTLFSDAHVYLDGIDVMPLHEGAQDGWRIALRAHLR